MAREDGDFVAGGVEVPREKCSDLAGAAGDEDSHGERLRQEGLLRLVRLRSMSIRRLVMTEQR